MDNYRFILSGGGTGGHIYPAIAIADELKRRYPEAQFLFVGAKDRMEMEKVPRAGYEIKGLWISGFQRKASLRNLMFPFKVISSLVRSRHIIKRFKPQVVIGTGGYASGPLLWVASGKGIPCLVQEQNSFPGVTNKLLKDRVQRICVAYDGMDRYFPKDKLIKTGNPVRSGLVAKSTDMDKAAAFFGLDHKRPTLLVLGGSLGSARINQLIAVNLPLFESLGMQVVWQCGKNYLNTYKKYISTTVKVVGFVDRMDWAYAVANIIISRSGAGAVSELCIVGKPVIFVPSPNVAEDHQTRNAEALVAEDAAVMIREDRLDTDFEQEFRGLYGSKQRMDALGRNMAGLALPHATIHIVDEIEKLLKTETVA